MANAIIVRDENWNFVLKIPLIENLHNLRNVKIRLYAVEKIFDKNKRLRNMYKELGHTTKSESKNISFFTTLCFNSRHEWSHKVKFSVWWLMQVKSSLAVNETVYRHNY